MDADSYTTPPLFPTAVDAILDRVQNVDPVKYGSTRNFIDGAVTYLSPYISRGVISTKLVYEETLKRGFKPAQIEKFIQELAWRDYWQQVWIAKGDTINEDLKQQQKPIVTTNISEAIIKANTGIEAIDRAINQFYETGYLHNHVRMYIAFMACNLAQNHWKTPAQWMYYHLLDGDWASNALSWQWVAGANSNKKYIANQENINKYCYTSERKTYLDVSYEDLAQLAIPKELSETIEFQLKTPLPEKTSIDVNVSKPTCIYNYYNLDPFWKKEEDCNRILLVEPSHFGMYPISQQSVDFMLKLSRENIEGVQVYVGEFHDFVTEHAPTVVYYKEHPLNGHYKGIEESRDWMFDVQGYFPSFFAFWKRCKKQITY